MSLRNNHVAVALRSAGLATLLFDLLTEEAADRRNVFDIQVQAPTLLIVGGRDIGVLELNEQGIR